MTEFLNLIKTLINFILNIGFGLTNFVGSLVTGGEFVVLTLVFITMIFIKRKKQDIFIKKIVGNWLFISTIIFFSVCYLILSISKGYFDFDKFSMWEKIPGALVAWLFMALIILMICFIIDESKNKQKK